MKLTQITFKQLEANGDSSVWVFNQTNPKGRVHINVRENHGDPILITVENTWIPMDLTTRCTREAILASSDFRHLANVQAIAIIDHESATEFMKRADAQKEAQKVYKRMSPGNTNFIEIGERERAETRNNVRDASMKVQNMCHSDMDEDTCMSMLRTDQSELNDVDLNYVVMNSKYAKVKALAAEFLKEMEDEAQRT